MGEFLCVAWETSRSLNRRKRAVRRNAVALPGELMPAVPEPRYSHLHLAHNEARLELTLCGRRIPASERLEFCAHGGTLGSRLLSDRDRELFESRHAGGCVTCAALAALAGEHAPARGARAVAWRPSEPLPALAVRFAWECRCGAHGEEGGTVIAAIDAHRDHVVRACREGLGVDIEEAVGHGG